jgi:hypothetical protein
MAWIIGAVNDEEIQEILQAGYDIYETLTEQREKQIFITTRKEDGDKNLEPLVMIYVDCDVTELLNLP